MDIQELRGKIDRVDDELVRLYGERMELAREIGRYKREKGLPVLDTERERNLLNRVGEKAGAENDFYNGRPLRANLFSSPLDEGTSAVFGADGLFMGAVTKSGGRARYEYVVPKEAPSGAAK